MSVLVFFRKSYVKAHQRRLKSGQVITIPAHYDKRTKKGAESPLAHGHDLRHLDAAKRAVFEKMHAEQHLLHHYHAHALRQRVQEQQGHLEGLAQEVAGFGPDVVVEAPDSVRDAVIRLLGAARERHTATPADAHAPGGMP